MIDTDDTKEGWGILFLLFIVPPILYVITIAITILSEIYL